MATSPSAQPLSGDGRVGAAHPLDPLTAAEIARAAAIVRAAGELSDRAFFVSITLEEPAKDLILAGRPAAEVEREAHVVVRDPASSTTHYGVVSLTHERVTTWNISAAIQAALTKEELEAAAEVVKADSRWLEAMARRGVDPELTIVEPWVTGYFDAADLVAGGRFVKPITFVRPAEGANPYARPIEGISMRVDLDAMAVVEFEDKRDVPLPPAKANFTADGLSDPANVPTFPDGVRRDIRALEVIQPEGPSFEVEGNEVRWQKWRFRIGFTYREGLVLHLLTYDDRGRERPILYRASTSEMFVPYGDVEDGQKWKGVFDIGDFGLGPFTNSLRLGCDCLGEIRYFDAVINDAAGEPVVIENAICLHEEDDGLLWKHFDSHSGEAEVRRARRLVISFIATIGNYDYAFYWHLHQDGSIGHEVRLTGVISAGAVAPGESPRCGTIVAPGVYGPNHQHFFSVRLDTMVDGLSNSVYECDSEPVPRSERNPHGGAWEVKHRRLERESDAQRLMSLERALLADRQRAIAQSDGPSCRLPVGSRRQRAAAGNGGLLRVRARRVFPPPSVGHALLRRRALRGRGLPDAGRDRRGPYALVLRRSLDRRRGRRGLVHDRCPSRGQARGLAGHAGHADRVPPRARRLLRRQPGARRPAARGLRARRTSPPPRGTRRRSRMTEQPADAASASATLPLPPGELFIGGEWMAPPSGREFDVLNPATEERIAAVARADEHDVDRAVRAARAAFDPSAPWRTMSAADRARLIWRLGDLIEEHAEELGRLESLDNGKPVHLARDIDMRFAADLLRYMAGWATKLEGASLPLSMSGPERPRVQGSRAGWRRRSDHPVELPAADGLVKIAPVLACGCTIALKPAGQTPLTALRLPELAAAAEIPPGVLNVVTGYGDAGAAMVAHPGIDKVAFTGSTEVGKEIVAASAGNLKRVSLELGGKSPSLVFADADLDEAIPLVADAVFFNAGSRAPRRRACTSSARSTTRSSTASRAPERP